MSEKQHAIQNSKQQIILQQQQHLQQQFLFEDFKNDYPKLDNTEFNKVPAKLQKQTLLNPSPAILMEDNIVDEKLTTCDFSTGSTILNQTQESLAISVDPAKAESTEDIYEQQRQYYFGSASTDPADEEQKQPVGGKSYKEEVEVTQLDADDEDFDLGEHMAFPSPRRQSITKESLENIMELNYEASSDEERLLSRDV